MQRVCHSHVCAQRFSSYYYFSQTGSCTQLDEQLYGSDDALLYQNPLGQTGFFCASLRSAIHEVTVLSISRLD
jgi:hypothetical protein